MSTPPSATAGSVIGAYLTFRVARKAGSAYLESKFKKGKLSKFLKLFKKWGTGTLIASTAVPIPTPTSMFFAAAGASDYPLGKFLAIVAISRAVRYSVIAIVADHYGRHFIRALRHPTQYWGWMLVFCCPDCRAGCGRNPAQPPVRDSARIETEAQPRRARSITKDFVCVSSLRVTSCPSW